MTIKPRSAWKAKPARSVTPWALGALRGVCVHWYGSPRSVTDQTLVPGQILAVQRSHQAGEFVDIAYSFVVDQWGGVWEGRGWDAQTGANGTTVANRTYLAVVVAIGKGDKPTVKALNALARLIALAKSKGVGQEVVPHGLFTGSECPGPDLSAWIKAGGWKTQRVAPSRPVDFEWARWFAGIGEFEKVGRRHKPSRPKGYPRVVPPRGWRALAWYRKRGLA